MQESKHPPNSFADAFQIYSDSSLHFRDQPVYRFLEVPVMPMSDSSPAWHEVPVEPKKADLSSLQLFSKPQELKPRPLTDVPCYFDKHTSFSTTEPQQTIFDRVIQSLESIDKSSVRVDFEYIYLKNKIKGVCYPNNLPCTFRVHVFRSSEPGVCLVEVQRRSGCVVQFSRFFAELLRLTTTAQSKEQHSQQTTSSNSTSSNASTTAPTAAATAAKKSTDDSVNSSSSIHLDPATLGVLVKMARSQWVDVQREGLRTIATACASGGGVTASASSSSSSSSSTSEDHNRKLVVHVAPLLTPLLGALDDEVVRNTSFVLAKLAESCCAEVTQKALTFSENILATLCTAHRRVSGGGNGSGSASASDGFTLPNNGKQSSSSSPQTTESPHLSEAGLGSGAAATMSSSPSPRPPSSTSILVQRETTRLLTQAVAALSKVDVAYLKRLPNLAQYVSALEKYSCSADAATRVAACEALDRLVAF